MTGPTNDENSRYCDDYLRDRDEARWLATRYCNARAGVLALGAMHHEVRKSPAVVTEAPLGEIRLQWWREAIDEIMAGDRVRAHPIVALCAATGAVAEANRAVIEAAIDARARLLYAEPFDSVDGLYDWLDKSEGYLAIARQLAFGEAQLDDGQCAKLIRAESAFALAGDARIAQSKMNMSHPPAVLSAALDEARAAFDDARSVLAELPAADAGLHVHLVLTPMRLGRGPEGAPGPFAPIVMRWRMFWAMASGRF